MAFNFKKSIVVGVSVSQEKGLEVAQIDFLSKKILKYGSRDLTYDNNRKEIADLDIFKETLADLMFELEIPKGSEVVLSLPTINFKITDYPASLDESQIRNVLEEDLSEHPLLGQVEASISAVRLPNSTMQFHKIAYTALQKTMLIEIAMQIKELGYVLCGIDTSIGSTLNSLIYNERVDTVGDSAWLLLIVENSCCRVLSMMGNSYVDVCEEKISIGEVLGDAENYSIVTDTVYTLLKNLPSQRLYIISKTDVISAKILADGLNYNGQIIHQDANCFASEAFLEVDESISPAEAKNISLDVIGAAIYRDIRNQVPVTFNLFNEYLGDIYLNEQPLVLHFNNIEFEASLENAIRVSAIIAVAVIAVVAFLLYNINLKVGDTRAEILSLKKDIGKIDKFLNDNNTVTTDVFNSSEEIQFGIAHNKGVYSYYTIVGTEIPKKLWLTSLKLGKHVTIEGQADNVESIFGFYRNVKDYNPKAGISLQSLDLASASKVSMLTEEDGFDTESVISSMNADFYSFRISNDPEKPKSKVQPKKSEKKKNSSSGIPKLEPLE